MGISVQYSVYTGAVCSTPVWTMNPTNECVSVLGTGLDKAV